VEAHGLERQSLAALRVVGEELAQVHAAELLVVRLERPPGGESGGGNAGCRHRTASAGWPASRDVRPAIV